MLALGWWHWYVLGQPNFQYTICLERFWPMRGPKCCLISGLALNWTLFFEKMNWMWDLQHFSDRKLHKMSLRVFEQNIPVWDKYGSKVTSDYWSMAECTQQQLDRFCCRIRSLGTKVMKILSMFENRCSRNAARILWKNFANNPKVRIGSLSLNSINQTSS